MVGGTTDGGLEVFAFDLEVHLGMDGTAFFGQSARRDAQVAVFAFGLHGEVYALFVDLGIEAGVVVALFGQVDDLELFEQCGQLCGKQSGVVQCGMEGA